MRLMMGLMCSLLSAAAGAEEAWHFEMKVYHVEGVPEGTAEERVLAPGQVLRIGEKALTLADGRLVSAAGEAPNAREVKLLASPSVVTGIGKATIRIGDNTPLQYLEHQAADQYRLQELDAELAITCTIDFQLVRGGRETMPYEAEVPLRGAFFREGAPQVDCEVSVNATWTTSRVPVPGVALPVGKPEIRRATFSHALGLNAGEWRAVVHPVQAENGLAPATLVLLIQAQPHVEPAATPPRAQAPSHFVLEATVILDPTGLVPPDDEQLVSLLPPDVAASLFSRSETLAELQEKSATPAEHPVELGDVHTWPPVRAAYAASLQSLEWPLGTIYLSLLPPQDRSDGRLGPFLPPEVLPDGSRTVAFSTAEMFQRYPHSVEYRAVAPVGAFQFSQGNCGEEGEEPYHLLQNRFMAPWTAMAQTPARFERITRVPFQPQSEAEVVYLDLGTIAAAAAAWDAELQQAYLQVYFNHTSLDAIRSTRRRLPVEAVHGMPTILEFAARDGETRGFYRRHPETGRHMAVLLTLRNEAQPAFETLPPPEATETSDRQFSMETRFIRGGRELDAAVMQDLGPDQLLEAPNFYALPAAQARALSEVMQDWPKSHAELLSGPRTTTRYVPALQDLQQVLEEALEEMENLKIYGSFRLAALPDGTRGMVRDSGKILSNYHPASIPTTEPVCNKLDFAGLLESYDPILRGLFFRWVALEQRPAVISDMTTEYFRTPARELVPLNTGTIMALTGAWDATRQQARVHAYLNHTHRESERQRVSGRIAPVTVQRVVGKPLLVDFTARDGETRGFYLRDPSSRAPEHFLVLMTLTNIVARPAAAGAAPDESPRPFKVHWRNTVPGPLGGGLGGIGGRPAPEVAETVE